MKNDKELTIELYAKKAFILFISKIKMNRKIIPKNDIKFNK
jgi:hypothetical protein